MDRHIRGMDGHVIVCGYGRVGRATTDYLRATGIPVVVVDRDEGRLAGLHDTPHLVGDVTNDATLREAGIARARALVAALDTDQDTVYVVLSARALRHDLVIVARARTAEARDKMVLAGATRAVNPQLIGGRRIAAFALQPDVADFLDVVMQDDEFDYRIQQVSIPDGSPFVGHTGGPGPAGAVRGDRPGGPQGHEGALHRAPCGRRPARARLGPDHLRHVGAARGARAGRGGGSVAPNRPGRRRPVPDWEGGAGATEPKPSAPTRQALGEIPGCGRAPDPRHDHVQGMGVMDEQQFAKVRDAQGFVAALDQSGGSTPKALRLYGVEGWADEADMFAQVHAMRARIMTSRAFAGDRILGAILFEDTLGREVEGRPTADYLWHVKRIVPIVKVDQGLLDEQDGARLMKPMPGLDALLARARTLGVFGTKMRSFVAGPGAGLEAVVDQQFEVGRRILRSGLVPILEPEVDITSTAKSDAERQLHESLLRQLDALGGDEVVMLKLTLPEQDDLYADVVAHPKVLRVFALSGGYSRAEANERLARQHGVVASFSRALTEGLRFEQSADEFDAVLDASIASIYAASIT